MKATAHMQNNLQQEVCSEDGNLVNGYIDGPFFVKAKMGPRLSYALVVDTGRL